MPFTPTELSARLEHGVVREIAASVGVSPSYVSKVVRGAWHPLSKRGRLTERRIQVAIARTLRLRLDQVFPLEQDAATGAPSQRMAVV